jgi:hypothetical protein
VYDDPWCDARRLAARGFAWEDSAVRRLLVLALPLLVCFAGFAPADEDSAKAAATRKLLKQNVTVEYKDEALRDVVDDLRNQIGKTRLFIRPDTTSGVQLNTKISLAMKDKPLEDVLNAICDKNGWGYFILTKGTYDGHLVLKVGKERGYEDGKESTAKNDKDKDKAKDKAKAKDKKEVKKTDPDEKPEPKAKAEPKDKPAPKERPVDDEDKVERSAALKLKAAKDLLEEEKKERAIKVLEDLLDRYPKSKAAEEAKELLEKLKK